ncbi:cellulose binding domain-containing protein [Micromonospora carbonacea]|uniref:Cellulose binding domain-containing protein n=1 Tax=Micromonospora carbonacea TaxID=47853 RepID=A0A7H8XQM4_9ACTN|nr:cellulose binding domain-containing protein [Micromonospora carbonacea]MBB5824798.1 chitodextrinase [Micromonospora carbonacea]QLD27054.1 cellulose binding domain-containing protein [Micromonospora carbonacea]
MFRMPGVVLAAATLTLATWAGAAGAAAAPPAAMQTPAPPIPTPTVACPPALPIWGQVTATTATSLTITYGMLLTPPCGYDPPMQVHLFTSREDAEQWRNPAAQALTGPERNGTVTVGGLTPNTDYWFRFSEPDGKKDPYVIGGPARTTDQSVCTATATVDNRWTGGFVATVTVRATGSAPVQGWRVSWRWPGDERISAAWNGVVETTGSDVVVGNASYNGTLAPGAWTTFGMMVWSSGAAGVPALTCSR